MTTSVIYPTGIAEPLGHLNSSRNDIEIFVEDTANLNMWRRILKAFLPDGVRFNDPIQLGGRERVLEECRADQVNDGRRKLYIMDADMDFLHGVKKPRLNHLYRIRAYCIENYLCHQSTLLEVCQDLDVDASEAESRSRLDLSDWIGANRTLMENLFVCYGVVRLLEPQIATVSYSFERLIQPNPNGDLLCPKLTQTRIFSLLRKLREKRTRYEIAATAFKVKGNISGIDFLRYSSGKSFILPLILKRIRRKFRGGLSDEQFKASFARHLSKSVDPYLAARLKKICH